MLGTPRAVDAQNAPTSCAKPHKTRFRTAPTRAFLRARSGHPIDGATKDGSVTVTYGLTGGSVSVMALQGGNRYLWRDRDG